MQLCILMEGDKEVHLNKGDKEVYPEQWGKNRRYISIEDLGRTRGTLVN